MSVSVSTVIHISLLVLRIVFIPIFFCVKRRKKESARTTAEQESERERARCDCFLWPMWPFTKRRMTFYFCTVREHFYENEENTIPELNKRFWGRAGPHTSKLQEKVFASELLNAHCTSHTNAPANWPMHFGIQNDNL